MRRRLLALARSIEPSDGIVLLLVAICLSFSIPQWGRIFAGTGHAIPIIASIVVSSMLSLVLARTFSLTSSLILSVVTFLALASVAYSADAGGLPSDLQSSWKALASTGLLVATTKEFLIVPVIIVWVASAITIEIIVRRGPSVSVLVPILSAQGATLAYTISQGFPEWWVVAGFAASGFALVAAGTAMQPLVIDPEASQADLIAVADEANSPIRWRQVVAAVPVVAILSAVGILANDLLPDRESGAFDLREKLTSPIDIFEATTPLASVKAGLVEEDPEVVFTIRVDGLSPTDEILRLPVATLDIYDGAVWTSSAQFQSAGAILPDPAQIGALLPGEVDQTVVLTDAYPFRFLPRAGVISGTAQTSLGWDPRSGTIARTDAVRGPGVFENTVRLPNFELPEGIDVGIPPEFVNYAAEAPPITADQIPVFESFLIEATEGASTEFARLQFVEQSLRSDLFGYNEAAPAGHSMAALASYLRPNPIGADAPGIRSGFSEQSAAVFAVLARQLRFPSRVVVGYVLGEPLTAGAPELAVSEDMIHAWPEVWIRGIGWFPFEPTNTGNDTEALRVRTPVVNRADGETRIADIELREPDVIPPLDESSEGINRTLLLAIGIVVLPFLYLVSVLLLRRFRTARRHRGDSAAQISGAWREVRDRLFELGIPTMNSASVLEVVIELEELEFHDIAAPLEDMVPLLDSALFAPVLPHPAEATAAWTVTNDTVRAAERRLPPAARLRATLTPRRLFHR